MKKANKINTSMKTKTDTVTVLNDKKSAKKIAVLYNELIKQSYQAFLKAVELGEELVKVKDSLAHGQFQTWLNKNTPFISERTARRYMAVFTKQDFLKERLGENLGLKDAYDLLQEQKKGKSKNPKTLTDSESNAIIEQHEKDREKKKKDREEISRIRKRIRSGKQVKKEEQEKAKSYLETRMDKLINDMEKIRNELSLIN